jgi:hypothetical protein
MRSASAATAAFITVLTFAQADAELLPAGPEFPITSEDTNQGGPSVDHFADGSVIVAWLKAAAVCCNGDYPLVGRIYDANGVAAGPEFALGNTDAAALVRAIPPGDRFVVVRKDGVPAAPIWRLYDDTGAPIGGEVTVTVAQESLAAGVAVDANGDLAILYQEGNAIRLQRYTVAGLPVGASIVVEEPVSGFVSPFGFEAASDGSLVVAWVHYASSGQGTPTGYVRRYDVSGAIPGSEFTFTGPHDDGAVYGLLETDGIGRIYAAVNFTAGSNRNEELTRFSLDGCSMGRVQPSTSSRTICRPMCGR